MSSREQGRRRDFDSSDSFILSSLTCFCLAFAGCSGNGSFSSSAPVAPVARADQPPQAPASLPEPELDLDAAPLSPNGCLDLSLLSRRMRTFPEGAFIREHTVTFKMENHAVDGKSLQHPRNMSALAALASFGIKEEASPIFSTNLPDVTQDECRSVTVTDRLGAQTVYSVEPKSLAVGSIRLKTYVIRGEARTVEQDISYQLKSPRELEITSSAPVMDRCPEHQKVMATTVRSRVWGSSPELQSVPILVAADFLRKISIAIREMPIALRDLIAGVEDGEKVAASLPDLVTLTTAEIDRDVNRCPYEAKPPGTDEAPPAEE